VGAEVDNAARRLPRRVVLSHHHSHRTKPRWMLFVAGCFGSVVIWLLV